jgi:hypothetical protein
MQKRHHSPACSAPLYAAVSALAVFSSLYYEPIECTIKYPFRLFRRFFYELTQNYFIVAVSTVVFTVSRLLATVLPQETFHTNPAFTYTKFMLTVMPQ